MSWLDEPYLHNNINGYRDMATTRRSMKSQSNLKKNEVDLLINQYNEDTDERRMRDLAREEDLRNIQKRKILVPLSYKDIEKEGFGESGRYGSGSYGSGRYGSGRYGSGLYSGKEGFADTGPMMTINITHNHLVIILFILLIVAIILEVISIRNARELIELLKESNIKK